MVVQLLRQYWHCLAMVSPVRSKQRHIKIIKFNHRGLFSRIAPDIEIPFYIYRLQKWPQLRDLSSPSQKSYHSSKRCKPTNKLFIRKSDNSRHLMTSLTKCLKISSKIRSMSSSKSTKSNEKNRWPIENLKTPKWSQRVSTRTKSTTQMGYVKNAIWSSITSRGKEGPMPISHWTNNWTRPPNKLRRSEWKNIFSETLFVI